MKSICLPEITTCRDGKGVCPYCGIYTFMYKIPLVVGHSLSSMCPWSNELNLYVSRCPGCNEIAVWHKEKLIVPAGSMAPIPNEDMPEDIRKTYEEARSVFNNSPRCAVVLLRSVLEKLCNHICPSCEKKFLNEKIAVLVKNGLSGKLQKAFDFIRVLGNNAVHELDEIDEKCAPEMALASFKLINIIVEKTITEDKLIKDLYSTIPKNHRDSIEARDKKPKKTADPLQTTKP